jgi:pre-mRNA-processing factor 19
MAVVCSLSGYVPDEPVISRTGYLFDRKLIVKFIKEHGRCPMTGEGLTVDDLKPILANKVVQPRPSESASLPNLLGMFQQEWDSLMTDTFNLKTELNRSKEELAHSLYQLEGACRVIARLTRERDDALSKITHLQREAAIPRETQPLQPSTDAPSPALPEDLIKTISDLSDRLLQIRKKRKFSANKQKEQVADFKSVSVSKPLHLAKNPKINSMACHPQSSRLLLTAGQDHKLHLFTLNSSSQVTIKGHSTPVTACTFHPNEQMILSGSSKGEIIIWEESNENSWNAKLKLKHHDGAVVALHPHPCGELFLSASSNGGWKFTDWEGQVISSADTEALSGGCVHPDGQMFALAEAKGVVKFWDSRTCQETDLMLSGHSGAINSLQFGQNGYYFATGGEDGYARVWDLRKSLAFYEFQTGSPVFAVSLDESCQYLAVSSGESITLHALTGKAVMSQIAEVRDDSSSGFTCLSWLPDAQGLLAASMEGKIVLFSDQTSSEQE